MVALLKVTDTILLWLNLFFLLCISMMPWTSDLVDSHRDDPFAIVTFSAVLGLAGLLMLAQWAYASHDGVLTIERVDAQTKTMVTLLTLRIPVVAIVSMILAFVHRSLGLWSWRLVSIFGAAIRRHPGFKPSE